MDANNLNEAELKGNQTISFGAGCFWGVEHAFKQVNGVLKTIVGYQGGEVENPDYKQVCTKTTGHAEVVQVTFDPQIVSLKRMLDAFFFMHDPTQLNRQGPDVGSQYRSCIFPTNEEQTTLIKNYIEEFCRPRYGERFVTTLEEGKFYDAETYHQDYLVNNPSGYCHIGLDVFQKLKTDNY